MNINVGIIGYGKMGKTRHETIDKIENVVVTAISEPHLDEKLDSIPNVSIDEIIESKAIDTVLICTPNFMNKPLTIRALQAGKNVFCEKPPAFNVAEMREIIEAKETIESGNYGKVLWMRGRYGKSVTTDYFKQWRAKRDLAGGGILIDQGIHMLDLFLFLGGGFNKVKAEVSNLFWNLDVEDNAFVILRNSETGMVASLHSTMTQWRHLFSLEIFMEKGYMVLNGLLTSSKSYGEEILSIAKNRSKAPAATWKDEIRVQYKVNNSWRYEMESFFEVIKEDKPIEIGNSSDALKLMTIIDEIYKQKNF